MWQALAAEACVTSRVLMLTSPRSGSSWLMSLVADRTRDSVLPLFELLNPGFPLAHLNIFDPSLFKLVKGALSAAFLAPLYAEGSEMHDRLARGDLNAVRDSSSSPNKTLHLGVKIAENVGATLQIVEGCARRLGRRAILLKVMLDVVHDRSFKAWVESASTEECTTLLFLQRNFFFIFSSLYKVDECEGGDFRVANYTECRPEVRLTQLEYFFTQHLALVAFIRGLVGDEVLRPPFARAATPRRAGAVAVAYEEVSSLEDDAAADLVFERLRIAGSDVRPSREKMAGNSTYMVQDSSGTLAARVANYDEVRALYERKLVHLCTPLFGHNCTKEPIFEFPA
ncbi:hypothetical protein AB1Y20_014759 [Prymnesium parvum]|uniref:Sulfotransferase n=1 Tax=Prymnesium parvum TaxID=97485 RepID=A0AB34IDU1_PRYPA